jgi:hypothetical protein
MTMKRIMMTGSSSSIGHDDDNEKNDDVCGSPNIRHDYDNEGNDDD